MKMVHLIASKLSKLIVTKTRKAHIGIILFKYGFVCSILILVSERVARNFLTCMQLRTLDGELCCSVSSCSLVFLVYLEVAQHSILFGKHLKMIGFLVVGCYILPYEAGR